jgi:hypothetical protein
MMGHDEHCWKDHLHCCVEKVYAMGRKLRGCQQEVLRWKERAQDHLEEWQACQRELATVEARERKLLQVLDELRHDDGCFCTGAFAGPGHTWSHSELCARAREMLDSQTKHRQEKEEKTDESRQVVLCRDD